MPSPRIALVEAEVRSAIAMGDGVPKGLTCAAERAGPDDSRGCQGCQYEWEAMHKALVAAADALAEAGKDADRMNFLEQCEDVRFTVQALKRSDGKETRVAYKELRSAVDAAIDAAIAANPGEAGK